MPSHKEIAALAATARPAESRAPGAFLLTLLGSGEGL